LSIIAYVACDEEGSFPNYLVYISKIDLDLTAFFFQWAVSLGYICAEDL
jgi:hypothetical protein